jgi:hypothetical protein
VDDAEPSSPTTSSETPYVRFTTAAGDAVVLAPLADAMRQILGRGTLYEYAAAHPERREFAGRAPAYAVPIGGVRTVVRHARHGGLLAPLTGDVFLAPTRAPYELSVSLQLRTAGVRTPELLGYALYPAGPLLRRTDVVTREIPDGHTLAALLRQGVDAPMRHTLFEATSALALALANADAFHADLNLTNVLIAPAPDGTLEAFALDVDRVIFRARNRTHLLRANFRRLTRSAARLGLDWRP